MFKHTKITAAKPLDKLRTDYDRKTRRMKKQDGQDTESTSSLGSKGGRPTKRYGGKSYGQVKSELKTVDQIRKTRKIKDQKKAKNARPSKKKRR